MDPARIVVDPTLPISEAAGEIAAAAKHMLSLVNDVLAVPPVAWMLDCLRRRGVQTLLVEAGGELLVQFLAADALDELYVTLCPLVIGGRTTPGLMGGTGFSQAELRRLTLLSSEVVGSEIFLHYSVNRAMKTEKS